jgi:hypothetical protein
MSFSKNMAKLFTNKYFLYFIVFLSVTNILGYLVTNKLNAVLLFVLTSLVTYQFSKNMTVILLIGLIVTNLFMSQYILTEGLENENDTNTALDKISDTDPDIAKAVPIIKDSKTTAEAKSKYESIGSNNADSLNNVDYNKPPEVSPTMDTNNMDLNKVKRDPNEPEGFGEKVSSKNSDKAKGPRLDYAATIEQSYQQLDELLGNDSIKQLTSDTQKLMSQQQNLFNTMNQMVPVLEGAQNMLKGFDIGGLTDSLKGLGSMGNISLPKFGNDKK